MILLFILLCLACLAYFCHTFYTASFLPKGRVNGSLSILGGSGYQRGVAMQETGINCESFECRYFPEVNDKLQGIGGESFLKAVSVKMSRDVTLDGEVNAATGIMAFTNTTACTVANAVNTYGDGSGTLLFDEATVSQNRTAWEKASVKLSSNPNLTLS